MTTEIVLTSPTTFLRIILETENCSFTHSHDGSILYMEALDNNFIICSDLSLKNASNEEIWSASMPCRGSFNQERIRVDSIFPFVFKTDETVQVFPSLILTFDTNCTCKGNTRNVFELRVKLALSSDKTPTVPKVTDIYSEAIVVEDTRIPVSKELLVASSPFFENLFNANFREKDDGVYEIKEISSDDFQWFIGSFHKRKWELSSLDRALLALSYADRFELLYLHSRVLPYLKSVKLPRETINDALILCSKFKRIENLILWVLNHCENEKHVLLLLQECAPQLNTTAVQAAFNALESIFQRKKQQAVQRAIHETIESDIRNMTRSIDRSYIIVHLRCFDLDGSVGRESAFGVYMDKDRKVYWDDTFQKIPTCYVVAKIGGYTGRRTDDQSLFKVSGYDNVARVDAYRK